MVECGWVPPDTRVQDFESAMRAVCEPIFERPISEISFGQLLVYLFQTASRFDMEVQPSLVLLQKTLLNIEGLGRQLYPELNLWDTAQPFLEDWVERRYSPQAVLQRLQHHAPSWIEQLPQLPEALLESLQQSQHKPRLPVASRQRRKRQSRQPLLGGVLLATAAFTAIPGGLQIVAEAPAAAWLLALTGIWLLLPRRR